MTTIRCTHTHTQGRIELVDLEALVLDDVLEFVYTAEVTVSESNVADLLAAADFLQLSSLQSLCCQFLRAHLEPSSCVGIYLSAAARNCPELAQTARRFALEHFRHVAREDEFQQLPFAELRALLQSPLLNTSGEGELLEVALSSFSLFHYYSSQSISITFQFIVEFYHI